MKRKRKSKPKVVPLVIPVPVEHLTLFQEALKGWLKAYRKWVKK